MFVLSPSLPVQQHSRSVLGAALPLSRSTQPHHSNTPGLGSSQTDQSKLHCVLQITLNWLCLWAGCFELLGFGMMGWVWVFLLDFGGGGRICFVFGFFKFFAVLLPHILSLQAIMNSFNEFHLLLRGPWISIYYLAFPSPRYECAQFNSYPL